jgi:hypothetical protein
MEQKDIVREIIKGLKIAIPGLIDCTGLTDNEKELTEEELLKNQAEMEKKYGPNF